MKGHEERGNMFLRKDGTYLQTKRGLIPKEGNIKLKQTYAWSSDVSTRESACSNSSSGHLFVFQEQNEHVLCVYSLPEKTQFQVSYIYNKAPET